MIFNPDEFIKSLYWAMGAAGFAERIYPVEVTEQGEGEWAVSVGERCVVIEVREVDWRKDWGALSRLMRAGQITDDVERVRLSLKIGDRPLPATGPVVIYQVYRIKTHSATRDEPEHTSEVLVGDVTSSQTDAIVRAVLAIVEDRVRGHLQAAECESEGDLCL